MRIQWRAGEPVFVAASIERVADSGETRSVTFVASDESVDRYGDVVRSTWNLEPFRKNPAFLWNHTYSIPAVGTVDPIEVERKKLKATANFTPAGIDPFADQLWELVKIGTLRAVSVGFNVEPENVKRRLDDQGEWTGGFEYNEPELLELSLVNVGANAHALAQARALGITEPVIRRVLLPDAFVHAQQLETHAALTALRMRGLRLSRPR